MLLQASDGSPPDLVDQLQVACKETSALPLEAAASVVTAAQGIVAAAAPMTAAADGPLGAVTGVSAAAAGRLPVFAMGTSSGVRAGHQSDRERGRGNCGRRGRRGQPGLDA